ncbi:MAG: HAMP domain-containing histidine kinase [Chloroflexi bacterium]|nr:HAMP domain-containing histidine kinase [Chloroflexota bacterium]
MLNLINDVLDMSKIESGSLTLFVVDDVDLGQLIKQAMSTGKTLLQDKPVQLTADIASDLPRIRGDRQRIMQVLLNIMSNACKFTSKGSISVSAYSDQDDVLIAIADTGPGIAPEDFGLVFEAFKQTTAGLRQGGGSGLGMPITKSLVEAHGGQIRLESEVGAGTTFTVTLPISSKILAHARLREDSHNVNSTLCPVCRRRGQKSARHEDVVGKQHEITKRDYLRRQR